MTFWQLVAFAMCCTVAGLFALIGWSSAQIAARISREEESLHQ